MQKPMNAQLSTTLGLGLLVISTVGTPGLEPSSKYFEIEFVNLWWNRLVGFRLKPKFGSVSGDCCSVISSRATLWLISCHMLDTGTRGCWMDFDETRFNVVRNGEDLTFCRTFCRVIYRVFNRSFQPQSRYKPEREYQPRSISKLYHRASCWIFAACVLWVTLLNVFTFRTVYFQSVFGNSLGRHAGAYICVTCTWDISSVTGPAWHGMKLACESLLPWSAGHVIMNCLNSSGTQCKFTL